MRLNCSNDLSSWSSVATSSSSFFCKMSSSKMLSIVLLYFNVLAGFVFTTPFDREKENFQCIKRGQIVSVGPQKYDCTMHGKNICAQLPIFSKDSCKECCKGPEEGKIKIKANQEDSTKEGKAGKSKVPRFDKSNLVSKGWKKSTIAVSVLSISIIGILLAVIFKQNIKSRSTNSSTPVQESEEATKMLEHHFNEGPPKNDEENPNDAQAQYVGQGDPIAQVEKDVEEILNEIQ